MNLLENYLKETHSVESYTEEWTKEFDKDFVQVDATWDCYGNVQRYKRVFDTEEWEDIKRIGHYMA